MDFIVSKNMRRATKLMTAILLLTLAALVLTACGNAALSAQLQAGQISICHATGSSTSPYEKITIGLSELLQHADHKDDIIPAPASGCPDTVQPGANSGKIKICHATSSATNPYNEISIDFNGLIGHLKHNGDIIPAPDGGCPQVTPTPGVTGTPTLTPMITQTVTGTPPVTTTPTQTATPGLTTTPGNTDAKITICHATGSVKNPYVMITVSVNGLDGHGSHNRDIIPAPAGGCPAK